MIDHHTTTVDGAAAAALRGALPAERDAPSKEWCGWCDGAGCKQCEGKGWTY